MKIKVKVGEEEKELHIIRQGERLRIEYDGQTTEARVVHQDGPHFVLEYEEQTGAHIRRRRLRAAGYRDGDGRQLWVNGSMVQYRRVREAGAGPGPAAARSLSASIPAIVSEVLVEEGENVTAGQKLILLESMKMVMPIQAPHDGVVRRLNCTAGEAVQPGVPLVEVKALDAETAEGKNVEMKGEDRTA